VHEAVSPLAAWESFYVIIGGAAAALTGLQFVVMALIADSDMRRSMREVAAFGTPTIVHFCVTLIISGILSAPWPGLHGPRFTLLGCGLFGVIYVLRVLVRARSVTGYQPVLEDWMFHVVLPGLTYAVLFVAAIILPGRTVPALFLVGLSALLLIMIGIHNAWDTVTYIAVAAHEQAAKPREPAKKGTQKRVN
jgi:hypothetical protein